MERDLKTKNMITLMFLICRDIIKPIPAEVLKKWIEEG